MLCANNKMEVTDDNFGKVLKEFPGHCLKAQFVTIDTEFTGLRHVGCNAFNYFDTLTEYYERSRQSVSNFLNVQYGICLWYYNSENDGYLYRAYNFYIFPNDNGGRNFMSQVSCLKFLAEHGLDFNKLFKHGISYLTPEEVAEKLDRLKNRKLSAPVTKKQSIQVPKEFEKTVDGAMTKIKNFLKSKGPSVIPRYNSFVRRLIYQEAKDNFGPAVLLETNEDGTMKICEGITEEELAVKTSNKSEQELQKIKDSIGFSQIIRILVESGKPIVGHNVLIDLLYTINQFLRQLPPSYEEFCELAHDLFPRLIDTKYLATASQHSDYTHTSLAELLESAQDGNMVKTEPYSPEYGYCTTGESKPHEAGYDAFITGQAFLAIVCKIGKSNDIFKTLPTSPLLAEYLNKLSTPRMHGVNCIDLLEKHSPPSRNDVFHITFPEKWNTEDVTAYFHDCGFIILRWINSTSAFIGVKDEAINAVKKLMTKNSESDCKISFYSNFRKSQQKTDICCECKKKSTIVSDDDDKKKKSTTVSEDVDKSKKRRSDETLNEDIVNFKRSCAFSVPDFE